MRYFIVVICLGLAGCASQSRYDIDMSMSELSDAIESSSDSIVEVPASFDFSSAFESSVYFTSTGSSSWDGFANNRVTFSSRQVFDLGTPRYTLGPGYEFAYTGGDDFNQLRVGFYFNEARFRAGEFDGFNSPVLLGLDIDGHIIKSVNDVDFFFGGRVTSALLGYEFDTPIEVLGDTLTSDSLGIFGLGTPIGLHVGIGSLSLETVFTPTLFLHASETSLGAENDLVTWHWNAPITFGLGYNW